MEELAKKCQKEGWFLRISMEWVKTLYLQGKSNNNEQNKPKNYALCLKPLDQMYRSNNPESQSPQQSSLVDTYLRQEVLNRVLQGNMAKEARLDIFPGPMAMQLCRRDLNLLSQNDYWITEKSDGIRAMLLNHNVPDFPRWSKWKVDAKRSFQCLSLYDNLRLEAAYAHARQQGITVIDVRLGHRDFRFRIADNKLDDKTTKEQFFVCRDYGWSFTYLFDRKFEFFLCTEQFTFVTPRFKSAYLQRQKVPLELQKAVILDGEVIFNLVEKRYNYTVYDVCCCTDDSGETQNYGTRSMTERKAAIKFVSECHHYFNKALLPPNGQPKSLQLLPKHFYQKSQFEEVRACIKPSPAEPNKYLYKNYNLNDGLVFTPDSADLYTFAPGSNSYLLKWKWPSKLTADFLVVPAVPEPNEDAVFYFYFWVRSSPIFYRTMKLHPKTESTILDRLRVLEASSGKIVECSFHTPEEDFHFDAQIDDGELNAIDYVMNEPALWQADLIRDDKNHANGFKVIANTLENIIEDVTEDELRYVLLGAITKPTPSVLLKQDENVQRDFESHLIETECLAHFKVTRHHTDSSQLYLSYSTQIPKNPNVHWNYYVEFKNCTFAYPQHADEIHRKISQNPMPDILVRCLFVPQQGKWKVFDLDGEFGKSSASHLLRVLEYMTCTNARVLNEAASVANNGESTGDVYQVNSSLKRARSPDDYSGVHYGYSTNHDHHSDESPEHKRVRYST